MVCFIGHHLPLSVFLTGLAQLYNPSTHHVLILSFLLGIFNVNCLDTQSYFCKQLERCLSSFTLEQIVDSHTHYSPTGVGSIIDLAFLSDITCAHSTVPPLSNSDHNGVDIKLAQSCSPTPEQRTVWNYSKANLARARILIDKTDWNI